MILVLMAQLLLLGYLVLQARSVEQELIEKYKQHFQLAFLAPIFISMTEQLNVAERLSAYIETIQHRMMSLYGFKEGKVYTFLFVAQLVGSVYVCFFLATVLALLAEDMVILALGVCLALLVPFVLIQGLNKQLNKKNQQILIELPEVLSQIILLVNAGESVQQAILRIQQRKTAEEGILYSELHKVAQELRNNISFRQALEGMSRRCSVQEVSMMTTTILLNYRRGGSDLIVALRLLSKEMWIRRKTITKTLGEQASSKLVFPMVLLFLVVLVIIATPAILQF